MKRDRKRKGKAESSEVAPGAWHGCGRGHWPAGEAAGQHIWGGGGGGRVEGLRVVLL